MKGSFDRDLMIASLRVTALRATMMHETIGLLQATRGDKRAMGMVDRAIHKLSGREERYAAVWAQLLRAGQRLVNDDIEAGIEALAEAERLARAASMNLMAASAQLRRGQLLGGAEGAQLVAEATTWMTGQGIRSPERMARVWSPGANGA